MDDDGNWFGGIGEMRLVGKKFVASAYSYVWNGEEYVCLLTFTEIEFSEETATLKGYVFEIDSPDDTTINFDTYSSNTPDKSYVLNYDMVNVNEY